jgi:hypothetical protein
MHSILLFVQNKHFNWVGGYLFQIGLEEIYVKYLIVL